MKLETCGQTPDGRTPPHPEVWAQIFRSYHSLTLPARKPKNAGGPCIWWPPASGRLVASARRSKIHSFVTTLRLTRPSALAEADSGWKHDTRLHMTGRGKRAGDIAFCTTTAKLDMTPAKDDRYNFACGTVYLLPASISIVNDELVPRHASLTGGFEDSDE